MKKSLIIVFLLFFSLTIYAQEKNIENKEEKKNDLSLFLGNTSNADASAFTIGADYQYRVNRILGVGAFIDYASGKIHSTLIGPAIFVHVWNFEFTIAPSVEFSDNDVAATYRLGVQYDFEMSKFSVSPALYFDSERKEKPAWVYGVSFGFKF